MVKFARKQVINPQTLVIFTMKPSKTNHNQGLLFQHRLSEQLNPMHELRLLSELIDWNNLEEEFSPLFKSEKGAPAKPVRLIVGILMLQHMYDLSDDQVVYQWVQNGYWQFFCGFDYFLWELPINPSSLSRWRKRLGPEGLEKVLRNTIRAAINADAVKESSLTKVIVDTTVMPKNITFPTDSKLYLRGIQKLVSLANRHNVVLRQSYKFLAPRAFTRGSRYAHARQMKRAKKEWNKLKTYLGRVYRDVIRRIDGKELLNDLFNPLLQTIEQLLAQEKTSKNKVYSIHEPHVACISKGKAHKKYEFGAKVSCVVTHKNGLVLSSESLPGNPYDGHTLKYVLEKAAKLSGKEITEAYADKGYKGHKITEKKILISGQKKGVTRWFKAQLKRRQAIEPHLGHMKSDGKLDRNYLRGVLGDKLNAVLCGIGHNLRLIIRHLHLNSRLPINC